MNDLPEILSLNIRLKIKLHTACQTSVRRPAQITDNFILFPKFLLCRIKYRPQVTYGFCEAAENGSAEGADSAAAVYDGAPEILDFVLSPMMAAKWLEDNQK